MEDKKNKVMERRSYLINQLHDMGVFYHGDRYIEKLTLAELEYYHITRKCEFVNVLIKQKGHLAGNKMVLS